MTPDGASPRSALAVLVLLLAAAPARAQFRRTGLLSWRFDDMTVNSGAGRVHASQWAQAYSLDLDGPLLSPNFGTMKDSFAYSKGASITQAANTSIPSQEQTTLMASADLFSTALRRYVRFSPNFSRTYLHQEGSANGLNYSNTVANTSWGLSTGLSLPKLPAVSYSRQVNDLRNPNDVAPVKQRSTTESKSVSYFLGHLVVNASEQTDRIDDRLGVNLAQEDDYKQASAELNFYEPRWIKLQSLYARSDLSQIANNGSVSQKTGSASLGLTTLKFGTGRWSSALNYGANGSRDFLRRVDTLSHNGSLNSTRPIRAGTLANALSFSHTPSAPSESVGDGVSANQTFWRGSLGTNAGVSGSWSRAPGSELVSDGANARADLFPSRPLGWFIEARTNGEKALRGAGGSRVNRYGIGGNDRQARMTVTGRFDRTESRYYSSGAKSISHQLTIEGSGRPTLKLFASGGYNLGLVGYEGGPSALSQNLHASVDWEPARGLDLSASATWAQTGYLASTSLSYSVGKTSFKLSYEYRDLSTAASYSHFSASLSRAL